MDLERPFALKEKIIQLGADREHYKDKDHSLQKFAKMKRFVERKRVGRRRKNEKQIGVYEDMLEHLRDKEKQPGELELDFLYVIRSLLNEGWILGKEEFFTIMETIDINSQTTHQVRHLIKILRKSLNIKEKEYRKWLVDHGAVLQKFGKITAGAKGGPISDILGSQKSPVSKETKQTNLQDMLGQIFVTQDS